MRDNIALFVSYVSAEPTTDPPTHAPATRTHASTKITSRVAFIAGRSSPPHRDPTTPQAAPCRRATARRHKSLLVPATKPLFSLLRPSKSGTGGVLVLPSADG
mmetsp:Transcript_12450/g.29633  ORF Transcript_12450/g.29633 Transcript_12450/m.29633 type:complete len:103 (+) Transcript_12450:87-395(+)